MQPRRHAVHHCLLFRLQPREWKEKHEEARNPCPYGNQGEEAADEEFHDEAERGVANGAGESPHSFVGAAVSWTRVEDHGGGRERIGASSIVLRCSAFREYFA